MRQKIVERLCSLQEQKDPEEYVSHVAKVPGDGLALTSRYQHFEKAEQQIQRLVEYMDVDQKEG